MGTTGARLREYRRSRGLTQQALADELGIADNTVARWERGVLVIPPWVGQHLAIEARARGHIAAAEEQARTEIARLRAQLEKRLDEVKALHGKIEKIAGHRDYLLEKNGSGAWWAPSARRETLVFVESIAREELAVDFWCS